MKPQSLQVAAVLVSTLALITGCGRKDNANIATQVAARVNSDEITVHQVNNVLARNPNIAPEASAQAKREILDRLIDQQLARQKAIENKLDRSPNVVQSIEAAKTEILARAYLEQVAAAIPKTAAWEVQKYYNENPELFAQRRLFNIEEIAFVANSDVANGLRDQLPKFRSMQEIADWLQSRGVKFAVNRGVRAAEQILLEILPKVQAMKEDQIQLFDLGSERFVVVRVVAYKVEPVDEASAAPRIQQFLLNRRSAEVIATEMKKIREGAKIEYLGEFAGDTSAAEAKAKAEGKAQVNTGEFSRDQTNK